MGWSVVTIWECRLRRAPDAQVRRVVRHVQAARGRR
jgi:G:T-mismatch repair DNA endonuclease (very short patch repair protein)